MPKIDAPTIAEHRAMVQARLVDAADEILRSGAPELLTAHAVTAAAGIARNSIYRYVDSVDDLRGLVLARYLPAWLDHVENAMVGVTDPEELLVVWAEANLRASTVSGHGWLMNLGRNHSPTTQASMERVHGMMHQVPNEVWAELLPERDQAAVAAAMTLGLLETGFRLLERGIDVEQVTATTGQALRGMIGALTG
ncbi:MAG: TetR/AcrR family transcriptional regulator [Arachnia sp.]